MAINRTSISSQSIRENTDLTIEILATPPDTTKFLSTPRTPNVMVGYYNPNLGIVQLYLVDGTGRRYISVI